VVGKLKPLDKIRVEKDGVEYEFEVAEEGGYVVSVPAYSSCVSQGETFEEALENIEDALRGCLATARELNLPIPESLRPLAEQADKLLRSQ
jgi:predicted RNase H-like HicB family nuclease